MRRRALSVAFVIAAAAAVRAQSAGTMHSDHKMAQEPRMDATYVGCLEAGTMAHAFVLTHVTHGDHMEPAMKDGRKKKKDAMAGRDHEGEMMQPPSAVSLNVAPVDVSEHVGHKVSIVGSIAAAMTESSPQADAMTRLPVLTVKSVKMIATKCP